MRTIEHMAMFVVKSIHIQINSQVMDLSMAPSFSPMAIITAGLLSLKCPAMPVIELFNTRVHFTFWGRSTDYNSFLLNQRFKITVSTF